VNVRIGQIKVEPKKGALPENHATLLALLEDLGSHRLDVVVTPECFLDGYIASDPSISADELRRFAIDPRTSPYTRDVSQWARTNSVWVIYGCTRASGSRVLNSALVYDREGRIALTYDKLHLAEEDLKFAPGQTLHAFDTDFGRCGVMICADRRWPETARTLALQGSQIVFNPTFGFRGDLNVCMMRTRSYENEMFIVFTHPDEALITDPSGNVICRDTSQGTRFVVNEIDLSRAATFSHLEYRRPDVYQL
jgi:beta-ureidopropionase